MRHEKNGAIIAEFIYDADGRRVKSIMDGETRLFAGDHYEVVVNGTETKYYFAGSSMIALRKDGVLNFVIGDHLGSTSLTTDADGVVISELLYTAWGEVRHESGVTPTDHTYTGQYSNVNDFGLMHYRARWMDPQLGRFSQPDTIIPSGVQGLDRYAYTFNNPVHYTDPSGHWPDPGAFNPFSYNTVTLGFKGILAKTLGINADISFAVNMKAIREFDLENFEAAILVNLPTVTFGPQTEAAALVELGGYNSTIEQMKGFNPALIEGSASVNASYCSGLCFGAGTTIDIFDPDGISSIRYSVGGGVGYELSVDVIGLTDAIGEQHGFGEGEESEWHVPVFNSGFWKETHREFIAPLRQLYEYLAE
jgi:RHS repeat-associated protein